MSAANWLEAAITIAHRGHPRAGRHFDTLIERARLKIEPVTLEQVRMARQAYVDCGKGRHPAGLNGGDVFAYALAKLTGEPLLFKGNDFPQTDIEAFPLNSSPSG
jgi:ribonuclease VapC